MEIKKYYNFLLYALVLLPWTVFAQFPYTNKAILEDDFSPFSNSDKADFKSYGIELTSKGNQTKGIYLKDLVFSSNQGFVLRFDYAMTGRGVDATDGVGNGLAVVLFDGNGDNPAMGASGSGGGFSYSKSKGGSQYPGLTKGFLSVGLDLYGDFKIRRTNSDEFRNGIYTSENSGNHITIRGQGNGVEGYPILISQSVENINQRYRLNIGTGSYSSSFDEPDKNGFSFRLKENEQDNEIDSNVSFGHPSYRRVELSMLPGTENNTSGFFLNVDVVHGNETSHVINSYFIPFDAFIFYKEAKTITVDELTMKRFVVPQTFKVGFTGFTGLAYQKNIVRNISIYLPFSPLVQAVEVNEVCKDDSTIFDVLEHSVGFNSNQYTEGEVLYDLGKKEYLDPYSFQFLTLVNGSFVKTLEPFIAVTVNGRYEYNPKTTQVEFIPVIGMSATEDQVYFNIKNKEARLENADLGGEQFRSDNAMIKLNFTHNCNNIIMVNGNSF